MELFVGIDWSEEQHQIYFMNKHGARMGEFDIAQTPEGFEQLNKRVAKLGLSPDETPVAVETAHNPLIDFLWDQGYQVYVIPPSVTKSNRGRFGSSQARTDEDDARLLADVLRTDRTQLSRWQPDGPLVRRMRAKMRFIRSLTHQINRRHNQLRAVLLRVYPQGLGIFSKLTQQISLRFLKTYPTPQQATALSLEEFRAFCKEQGYSAPTKIPGCYTRLQRAVPEPEPTMVEAYQEQIPFQADLLLQLVRRKAQAIRELETLFAQHPDHEIFDSIPGAGALLAPSLLVKFGDHRNRFPDASDVQALAGTCPVTVWSGKKRVVKFRRACDREFRDICQQLARTSVRQSDWAAMYLQDLLDSGKDQHHAYRCLANRWLAIAWKLWQSREPYDEAYHMQQVMRRRRPPHRH